MIVFVMCCVLCHIHLKEAFSLVGVYNSLKKISIWPFLHIINICQNKLHNKSICVINKDERHDSQHTWIMFSITWTMFGSLRVLQKSTLFTLFSFFCASFISICLLSCSPLTLLVVCTFWSTTLNFMTCQM